MTFIEAVWEAFSFYFDMANESKEIEGEEDKYFAEMRDALLGGLHHSGYLKIEGTTVTLQEPTGDEYVAKLIEIDKFIVDELLSINELVDEDRDAPVL